MPKETTRRGQRNKAKPNYYEHNVLATQVSSSEEQSKQKREEPHEY